MKFTGIMQRKKTEHYIQAAFVQWIKRNHPEHWPFAIANGGKRDIRTAMALKAEGVSKGVPDIMIPSLFLFIEFKAPKGRTSAEQKKWIDYLISVGYTVKVCKTLESAQAAVNERIML